MLSNRTEGGDVEEVIPQRMISYGRTSQVGICAHYPGDTWYM